MRERKEPRCPRCGSTWVDEEGELCERCEDKELDSHSIDAVLNSWATEEE